VIHGCFCEHGLHDLLAPTGARGCAESVIRVEAAADDRRIAHTAGVFVESAAGRVRHRKISVRVQRHCAHRVSRLAVEERSGRLGLRLRAPAVPELTLAGHDERFRVAQGQAGRLSETLSTLAHEKYVRAFLQHAACQADGIRYTLDRGHRARHERLPVHHAGVQLDHAVCVQVRATACIEYGEILQDAHRGFDGIHCRPPAPQ